MATADVLPLSPTPAAVRSGNEIGQPKESHNIAQPPVPRTITELISQRARQYGDKPILAYPSSGTEFVNYSFIQLESFSSWAATLYADSLPVRTTSTEKSKVAALLGTSNIDYLISILALSRLGYTVLLLSTRLAVSGYESLLDATDCAIVVSEAAHLKTTTALKAKRPNLTVLGIIQQNDYSQPRQPVLLALDPNKETKQVVWIMHSSGSTGPPKPVYQTQDAALRNCENNMNMRGFITLPLYHGHGVSSVFRAFCSAKMIHMTNATLPLTRGNLLEIMRKYEFEIFYGVPYVLKLLSECPEGIAALAKMKLVMFGGSACPDSLGDILVEGGVKLISHYGCSECGQLMTSFRPEGDNAWNYVRLLNRLKPFVTFERQGDSELFELVVRPGWPSKVAVNRDDGSYATKDLFVKHPKITDAWKYVSRLDDTIILVNGEKAIPIAVEQSVRQHALVREAIVFGVGKPALGMLVIASENAASMAPADLLEAIWPKVTAQNAELPAYAQLDKDMVEVLPAGTEYPCTDKGTIIRQAAYRTFSEAIESVYRRFESAAAGSLVLSEPEIKQYIRSQIEDLVDLDEPLADDTDLFSIGVDSLQSSRLRAKFLQNIQFNGNPLPQNVVFEFPSISKLAKALISIRESQKLDQDDVTEQMADMVTRHSVFPQHVPVQSNAPGRSVVVTGATGMLGAHLAAQLSVRPDIDTVYCLVRSKSDEVAMHRVLRSMCQRGVYQNLPTVGRQKLRFHASDFADANLGLSAAVYESIAANVVAVMHCAWSVNFNKQLISFEQDCIVGARNLLLLCLAAKQPAPASFNFCSSNSTVAGVSGVVPATVPPLTAARALGYAQSKLVTEHIVEKAAKDTGLKARILRVGQITADTVHGIWNDTEAIPLMLKTATTFGALPIVDETARWLPVDIVATTFADISLSDTLDTVFNIVNPRSFHWTQDLLPLVRSAGLDFKEVNQKEWLRLLQASDPDPEVNPTVKLLDFYVSKYDNDEVKRAPVYDTSNAEATSTALRTVGALASDLVSKLIGQFLKKSWVPQSVRQNKLRLIVCSGPCGAGKTALAAELAERLGGQWIEGDAIHDAVAVTKMSMGTALSSLDRQIWLARIKIEILERVRAAQLMDSSKQQNTMILSCSALKSEYRDSMRDLMGDGSIETSFVMLEASEKELERRLESRTGHYMKSSMIQGQLLAMEPPKTSETDIFPVSSEVESPAQIADLVVSAWLN